MIADLARYPDLDAVYRASIGSGLEIIAVSSPASGEGASTLALELARRAAMSQRETLLVELTTRSSAIVERFGRNRHDWDEAKGSAESAMIRLSERLTGLPAPSLGRPSPMLRERATLQVLTERWRKSFDLLILDLPPVLTPNPNDIDPITAAVVANGVILSVMTGVTNEASLIAAVEQLKRAEAVIIGVVVNDRDNPTLADEIARELGRIERLAPGIVRPVQRWVLSRSFLRRRL